MATNEPIVHVPWTELLKTIPEVFGLRLNEEPRYQLVTKEDRFEVRHYDRQVRASIDFAPVGNGQDDAFRALASYLFGKNRMARPSAVHTQSGEESPSQPMAMTAPVLQNRNDDATWTMSFILPIGTQIATAPRPLNPDIRLESIAPYEVAVTRYSGSNSPERMHVHREALQDWLLACGEFQACGSAYSAQYDAPFVLPFVRRNEVHIPVHRRH